MGFDSQKEALLNEYKGNLFEYLVADQLAQKVKLTRFRSDLTPEFYSMLSQQESFIRNYYPELLNDLPKLAIPCARKLLDYLGEREFEKILVVGKGVKSGEELKEADLLLHINGTDYGVSLKLAKTGLPTNTKSAGLKSFLTKYFNQNEKQFKFNKFYDFNYNVMARDLHEIYAVEYDSGYKFWKEADLPVLPGELIEEAKHRLYLFYDQVAQEVLKQLEALRQTDPNLLLEGLMALMGLSDPHTIQVTEFYEKNERHYVHANTHIANFSKNMSIEKMEQSKSTIHIQLKNLTLYLRVKPMNTFTSAGFKLNGAIRYH